MSKRLPDNRENRAADFNEKRADRLNTLTIAAIPCIMIAGAWLALTVSSFVPALVAVLLLAGVLLLRRSIRREAVPQRCPACDSDNIIRSSAAGDIVSPLVIGIGTKVSNEYTCGHCGHRW